MNKKEENNENLKKPEPFAYKNWTELIKPTKIDVDKKETKTFGAVSSLRRLCIALILNSFSS